METNGFPGVGNRPVDAVISEGQENVHEILPPSEEAFSKEMREDKHRDAEPADHDAVMNEAINEPSATTTPFTPPLNNVQSPEENASPIFEHPLSPTTAEGMSALRIEDIVTPTSPAFPTSVEASVDLVETTAPASQDVKDMDVEEVIEKRPRNSQQHNSSASNQMKKQTPLPATNQSSASVQVTNGRKGPGMSRDQQKYCSSIIKVLKKHRDAFPFLKPVDIVAFNIPHYPEIIKQPMDLSLVEQKLDNLQYASPEEFASDVQLIFNNCYTFNGRDSEVSKMAEGMEATFERQMQKMPVHKDPPPVKEVAPKVSVETPPKPPAVPKSENPTPVTAAPKKGASKVSKKTPTPPPPPRRFSEDGRPKREIHPPPPKDLPEVPSTKRNPRNTDPQLKWGSLVIKELKKTVHREYNWPFLHPVDPIALNIPDYPTIVTKPMDISTIERKLRDGEYANGMEFEEDWRLMFANCYLYNPEGTLVNTLGHKMEALFDSKWAEKPPPPAPEVEEDQESSEDDSAELEKEKAIADLQRTLEIVQAQLQTITQQPITKKKKDKKDKTKSHGAQKPVKAGAGKTTAKPKPAGKRKRPGKGKGDEEYPEFTFEQKKELSEKINSMDQDQLPEVVRIIQSSMPLDGRGEEEIELDIDALDRRILHKLHTFVVGKPAARKRPPAKKAKTHFSEEESNRKIFKLEQKLEEFNQKIGPTSSQDVNMNEDDGSSSDSDSGSSTSGSDSDDSGSSTD